ncbi:MAG: hypothetical protein ACW98K_17080 [Candidatus Kariarchaeaceae archaeon]|jgi:hypothetical protein
MDSTLSFHNNKKYVPENHVWNMENPDEISVDQVHATLSNTSVELAYLFWEVPRDVQMRQPSPDTWSPLHILIHLRQVAEVYAGRCKRVLTVESEELPILHDFDEQKQMKRVNIEEETVKSNLNDFMKARSKLLNTVSFVDKEEWNKKVARHETIGEISLLELLIPLAQREKMFLDKLKDMFDTLHGIPYLEDNKSGN